MHVKGLIVKYFAGDLGQWRARWMRGHLRDCERCRADYDVLARGLRFVADKSLTNIDRQHVAQRIGFPTHGRHTERIGDMGWQNLLKWPRWQIVVPATVFAGVVAFFALRVPDNIVYKGEAVVRPTADVALEVFSVQKIGEVVDMRPVSAGDVARLDGWIQFRSNVASVAKRSYRYLYVVGKDEHDTVFHYLPRPPRDRSVLLDHVDGSQLLMPSIRLDVKHRAGKLWIWGLFSESALSREAVEAALNNLHRDERGWRGWERANFSALIKRSEVQIEVK